MNNTKWKDLNIKERLAIASACLAFLAGWLLTAIAAFVPLLLSEQGILWILGQSLVYSASVFGISAYFKSENVQLRRDMDRRFRHMEKLSKMNENLEEEIEDDEG